MSVSLCDRIWVSAYDIAKGYKGLNQERGRVGLGFGLDQSYDVTRQTIMGIW
jgi:hypothetical protein